MSWQCKRCSEELSGPTQPHCGAIGNAKWVDDLPVTSGEEEAWRDVERRQNQSTAAVSRDAAAHHQS